MKDKSLQKTRILATKVTEEEYDILKELSSRINRKPYSLLQLVVNCLLRYGDSSRPVGQELSRVINSFEAISKGKGTRVKNTQREAVAALYFIKNPVKGEEAVLVQGGRTTSNGDRILRRTLQYVYPTAARMLRRIEASSSVNNWIEIIEEQLSKYDFEKDEREYIRSLFSDNSRDEFGNSLEITKYEPKNRVNSYLRTEEKHKSKKRSEDGGETRVGE